MKGDKYEVTKVVYLAQNGKNLSSVCKTLKSIELKGPDDWVQN